MELLLASRNRHKTREFAEVLGAGFEVNDLSNAATEHIDEIGKTFAENATLKAIAASKDRPASAQLRRGRHLLVIADDSGLEVVALEGAPGIYSARYAGESATDSQNVGKLLRELKNVTNRTARFRCVIALAQDGKLLGTFAGAVEGEIVDLPRGANGFGYDPIFRPKGFAQTFAEMAPELKNKLSHRANAIAALREALRKFAD
ncbi:MAG: non-canonical purine NTP pyrophosphatase, RdgB/HAM1 family [Verrucomicrobia bacterium]|nr:MAG: non-canonical purine NTP pyrophosphatase, RdgB/HAM1 family [Verrucomicrobiota bacterium]